MKQRTLLRASFALSPLLAVGCAGTGQPEVDDLAYADAASAAPIASPGGSPLPHDGRMDIMCIRYHS